MEPIDKLKEDLSFEIEQNESIMSGNWEWSDTDDSYLAIETQKMRQIVNQIDQIKRKELAHSANNS